MRVTGLACCTVVAACGPAEPQFDAPRTLGGVQVSAQVLNRGAEIYRLRCVSCHGEQGAGDGPAGRALHKKPRDFRQADFEYKSTPGDALPTDDDIITVIREGRVDTGMPAWPGLTDADLSALVQYIKTFSPRWAAAKSDPKGADG